MSSYAYEAVNAGGLKIRGTLNVSDQAEALRRVKEMGLFPIKIVVAKRRWENRRGTRRKAQKAKSALAITLFQPRVKGRTLAVFTRQLATLIEAGMPLLRGLRTLEEQGESAGMKRVIAELGAAIEGGSSLSEALSAHPKVFGPLYVNMVKAGELAGALELTLRRLAEFMEKAQKIKSKVIAGMFYPAAVMTVAAGILALLLLFVVPKFQQVFDGLIGRNAMPAFTLLVLDFSQWVKTHFVFLALGLAAFVGVFLIGIRTARGRWLLDFCKLKMPVLGPVFRKVAISRFARTLGTLTHSGVPILQALNIVKETTGNLIVGGVVSSIHDSVKEGETITAPLKESAIFPAMVAGMVDIGEQTGALPDMLLKIADDYDEQVDNAVSAMTSLLEPIMIVFLAIVVGSIVIAMFLPLLALINHGGGPEPAN